MSIKKIKKKIEGNEKKIVEDEDEDETNLKINIQQNANDKKSKYSIPLVYCIIIFICFFGNIILTFFQLENVQTYN